MTLRGSAPGESDVHRFHAALAAEPALESVEIDALTRQDERKWTFDLSATPSRWFTPVNASPSGIMAEPEFAPTSRREALP